MSTTGIFAWPSQPAAGRLKLAQATAASAVVCLALAGLLICLRRLSGAFSLPCPAGMLWTCGVSLALVMFAARRALSPALDSVSSQRIHAVLWAIPSLAALAWGWGLSSADSNATALAGFWGLVLLEEGWSWGVFSRRAVIPPPLTEPAATAAASEAPAASVRIAALPPEPTIGDRSGSAATLEPDILERESWGHDPAVLQQMVRRRDEDDRESIEGWLRADLAPGQRHVTAHLAICPSLAGPPQCFAEQADGPPADIKVAQVLPFGVRLEIKLDEPATEATSVLVDFVVHEAGADNDSR